MNRLIVGCGYLGLRVAQHWQASSGDAHSTVWATTRRLEFADTLRSLGIKPVLCDVLDPAPLRDLPPFDTVVYAVGFDRRAGQGMRAVYVDGLRQVLQHLPTPSRLIYVSSSSVYGQTDGSWVDEQAATKPDEESGRIVLAAEDVLRERLPESIVLRFSGIYGPGRLLRRQAIEQGQTIVGDADKWLNLIHVDDGVAAVLAAERVGVAGAIYNVCDGEPVRRRDFYAELARLLHAPVPTFAPIPADQPIPPHEKGNRRIQNRRLVQELCVELRYPDFRVGLAQAVESRPL